MWLKLGALQSDKAMELTITAYNSNMLVIYALYTLKDYVCNHYVKPYTSITIINNYVINIVLQLL